MLSQKQLKKLFKLCVAEENIKIAKSIYSELAKLKSGEFDYDYNFHAKSATLIMTYAKPFGKNRGVGRLSHKEVKCEINKDEKNVHKLLLKWRNKLYAHSDIEYIVVFVSENNGELITQTSINFFSIFDATFKVMGELFDKTFSSIQERKNELSKLIFDLESVKKNNEYELYFRNINKICMRSFKKHN